jgi:hypothetical protein
MSDFIKGIGNLIGKFGRGPEVSDTITRDFTVTNTPTLILHNTFGGVQVTTGAAGRIGVVATRKARGITADADQRALEDIVLTFSQDGDIVRVDARISRATAGLSRQLWCDLAITVPQVTNLDTKVEAGNVELTGTRGNISAKVDAGNLEISGTSGPVVASVAAGNLEASDITLDGLSRIGVNAGQVVLSGALAEGASVEIRVDAGRARITLPQQTHARLDAFADVGHISITGWNVPVVRNITSATAAGELSAAPGGTLKVRVNMGDITLTAR